MTRAAKLAAVAALTLATAPPAWGAAEGPGTPQAIAAHAEFLSSWPAPAGGAGAVCVIDSGVDADTDLGPALGLRTAYDGGTANDTGARSDRAGGSFPKHGTYVAGVIGSQIDGVGSSGIWPAGKVISRRVFAGPDTGTTAADYIRAIDWCVNQTEAEVKVINLSISGLTATLSETTNLEARLTRARDTDNVNVVAAAGNNGFGYVGYPASAPGVFAVGATDSTGAFWSIPDGPSSNRGSGLDISTFGSATCLTTGYGTRLAIGSGTSYAAPVVSAVLAAVRSSRPDLTPEQAEQLLLDNADNKAAGKVLNAAKAFQAAGLLTAEQAAQTYPANVCDLPPSIGGGGGGAAGGIGGGGGGATKVDSPGGATAQPAPEAVPAPIVHVELPKEDPFAELRPVKPTLRSLAYSKKGVLTVRIAGYRAGQRAIFRVDRRVTVGSGEKARTRTRTRTYTRTNGTLRLKIQRWTRVRVELRAPGIGNSPTLTLRRSREF